MVKEMTKKGLKNMKKPPKSVENAQKKQIKADILAIIVDLYENKDNNFYAIILVEQIYLKLKNENSFAFHDLKILKIVVKDLVTECHQILIFMQKEKISYRTIKFMGDGILW